MSAQTDIPKILVAQIVMVVLLGIQFVSKIGLFVDIPTFILGIPLFLYIIAVIGTGFRQSWGPLTAMIAGIVDIIFAVEQIVIVNITGPVLWGLALVFVGYIGYSFMTEGNESEVTLMNRPQIARVLYVLTITLSGYILILILGREGFPLPRSIFAVVLWFFLIIFLQPPKPAALQSRPFEDPFISEFSK